MKKRLPTYFIFISLCFLQPVKSFSQHLMFQTGKVKWEAGMDFGPSFFLGDLGGHRGKGTTLVKDLNFNFTNLMKGVFVTAYPSDWFGFRFAIQTGKLEGDDAIITTKGVDELWRKQRNLDFRTNISEAYAGIEIFPLTFLNRFTEDLPRIRPYGLIGIGVFHFNPQGSLTDANGNKTWYYLHPLRTEGEGMKEYPNIKPYSLTQVNIPMALGLKFYLSDRFTLSGEFLYRKSFTDYIDDVSKFYIDQNNFAKYMSPADAAIAAKISDKIIGIVTPGVTRYAPGTMRGNPKQDDAYFSLLLKVGVQLGTVYASMYDRNVAKHSRCPARF